ncbi:MAG: hypothetical protein Fur0028_09220 [Bacteroidales bacterium]
MKNFLITFILIVYFNSFGQIKYYYYDDKNDKITFEQVSKDGITFVKISKPEFAKSDKIGSPDLPV